MCSKGKISSTASNHQTRGDEDRNQKQKQKQKEKEEADSSVSREKAMF
jgi:hypothetical protein